MNTDEYNIKFFTELTKILDEAKGDLTGEEAYNAEMAALDKIEKELDDVLDTLLESPQRGLE